MEICEEQILQREAGFRTECRGARMATGIHEAGHFVAAFALGTPMKAVVMNVSYLRGEYGDIFATYAGFCATWADGGYDFEKPRAEIPDAPPAPGEYAFPHGLLLSRAVVSCAGPAAEFRYRAEQGLPQTAKHTARGDLRDLEEFSRIERNASGGDPAAFLERSWRKSQRLLDEPAVWRAVDSLANELVTGIMRNQPDDPRPGAKAEFVITAAQAECIMTKAGLGRGEFAARLREREGLRCAA
jgi:hypothetical protein